MFRYRYRRFRQLGSAPEIPIAYVGMVLLVFVCSGLTFLGFAATMYTTDADRAWNRVLPFYGLLTATAGLALCMVTERLTQKLEIQRPVRGVFELLMIPGVVIGIAHIVDLICLPSIRQPFPPGSDLCGTVVGVEAPATMIWPTRLDRREDGRAVQAR